MRSRISRIGLTFALVLLAAGVGAAVVFAGNWLAGGPNKDSFAREANEICDFYASQLDNIPPPDDSSPGSIYETVDNVIPVLENIQNEISAVESPEEIRVDVQRFVELSALSIARLRVVRSEALERDIFGAAVAFTRWEETRDKAQALAKRLGLKCSGGV